SSGPQAVMWWPGRCIRFTAGAPCALHAAKCASQRHGEARARKKAASLRPVCVPCRPGFRPGPGGSRGSALARLETRVRLADHEDLATATNDLAVAVTGLRRLQGGQD